MYMCRNRLLFLLKVFVVVSIFSACSVMESFQEMNKKTEKLSEEIQKVIGTKPTIGWNIENTRLTNLNIYFESLENENISVATLKKTIGDVVREQMEKMPEELVISLGVSP